MPFWYSFRFSFQIQFRYAPDTDVILILIQIQLSDTVQIRSRYGSHSVNHSDLFPGPEMLQTRMSFCRLFRFQIQIQYKYTPDTEVIMLFIQKSNIVTTRICSRHGRHSISQTDSVSRYSSDTFQTQMSSWYSFRFNLSDTIQIRFRHGCHPDTHSDSTFRYSSDTLQIQITS